MIDTSHTAFFGDGEKIFRLGPKQILELEAKTGSGVGAIAGRLFASTFMHADILETLRLGLIGGGTAPHEASRLVATYAADQPILPSLAIAIDVLQAAYNGKAPAAQVEDAA